MCVPTLQSLVPRRAWLLVAAFVIAGLLMSLWLRLMLAERQNAALKRDFLALVERRMQGLENQAVRSLEVLYGLAALLRDTATRRREVFGDRVSDTFRRLPELQALEWIPIVTAAERAGFEAMARQQGLAAYRIMELDGAGNLAPASAKARYFPVLFAYPEAVNKEAIGLDLASHPDRLAAIERCMESHEIVATAPVRLVQEKAETAYGILIFAPVYGRAPDSGTIEGFSLVVYRTVDLLNAVLSDLAADGVHVRVSDAELADIDLYTNAVPPLADADAQGLETERRLRFGQRTWTVAFIPSSAYLLGRENATVTLYPLLSALLALLFGLYAGFKIRYLSQVEREVEARTRALTREVADRRSAEAAAQKAETLYRSMFENAVDGIFQSTVDGRFLQANSALARIYGYESREEFLESVRDIENQLYVDRNRRREFIEIMRAEGRVSNFVS